MHNVVSKEWARKMKDEKNKRKLGLEKRSNSVLGIFWFSRKVETEPVESDESDGFDDLGDTDETI